MTPEEELELVRLAILMGRTVTGCCEWNERTESRLHGDVELHQYSPKAIRGFVLDHVASGGTIHQIVERRPEYSEFDFYYKVILPVPEFVHGLFVEIRLIDADRDCPSVQLVNAHPQRK